MSKQSRQEVLFRLEPTVEGKRQKAHSFLARERGSSAIALTATLMIATLLAGCGSNIAGIAPAPIVAAPVVRMDGSIRVGSVAVSGATIQLYGMSHTVKGASANLIKSTVLSDQAGQFRISGLFDCTGIDGVYAVGTGGNTGAGVNNQLVLMGSLGSCADVQSSASTLSFVLNEASTVATAFAFVPFAADFTHIGSPNTRALTNAFRTVDELYSSGTGSVGGTSLAQGATAPIVILNTLANMLAACSVTTGSLAGPCGKLLGATGTNNTADAAFAIARNPGNGVYTSLTALSAPSAPFQPSLSSPPNDLTVSMTYASAGLSVPSGLAIDAAGNAWVANEGGTNLTELSPSGTVLASPTTPDLIGAQALAIDAAGNVWVANTAGNSVVKFGVQNGVPTQGLSFTVGGVNGPTSIAVDLSGNVFVANLNGDSVSKLTSSGNAAPGFPFAGNGLTVPSALAVDYTGSVLVTSGDGNVVKLSNAGAFQSTITGTGLQSPLSIALDPNTKAVFLTGNLLSPDLVGAVSEMRANGQSGSASSFSNGISNPFGVATDGTSAWVANSKTSGSLAEVPFGSSVVASPINGLGVLDTPICVAVDASGNIWTTNSGNNTVSKFVGLASPTVTPLVAALHP